MAAETALVKRLCLPQRIPVLPEPLCFGHSRRTFIVMKPKSCKTPAATWPLAGVKECLEVVIGGKEILEALGQVFPRYVAL